MKVNVSGSPIILLIAFIFLKLTHHIEWPWYWVLSPLWIPCALCIVVGLIVLIGTALSKPYE